MGLQSTAINILTLGMRHGLTLRLMLRVPAQVKRTVMYAAQLSHAGRLDLTAPWCPEPCLLTLKGAVRQLV